MAKEIKSFDISNLPELIRLAEEVREAKEPRLLRRDSEDVAILAPVRKSLRKRAKTKADYEAFRSAAGGWADVDTDKLISDIYVSRAISDRPPVKL